MSERPYDDAMRDLDERLDAALDALNAERAPDVSPDDDPELLDLIDTARLMRRLREPAVPDDDFPERLATGLAAQLRSTAPDAAFSPNGRSEVTSLPEVRRWRRTRAAAVLVAALMRSLTVVVLAGMLAGVVVGGLGGRLAMYVAGQMYVREHPGDAAITESSDTIVGTFSWGGTWDLLVEGMFYGVLGGLTLLLFRPWLGRFGRRWEGLAFGAILLFGAGVSIITSDNEDFQRIGLPWLNVLMFAALFIGFGPLIVGIARRLDRALPTLSFWQAWPPGRFLGSLLIFVVGGVTLLPLTLGAVTAPIGLVSLAIDAVTADSLADMVQELVGLIIAVVLLILFPLARIARTQQLTPFVARHHTLAALKGQRAAMLLDLTFAGLVVVGGALTLLAIVRILG